MLLISLTLVVTLLGILYLRLKHHFSYFQRHNIPCIEPQLFWGNMKGLGSKFHFKDINEKVYNRFKGTAPFVGTYTFFNKTIMVLDLDLIRQILIKDFQTFPNRNLFHNVRDDPLTGNLLFLDGEAWRVLRHKLSPVFTTGKIRQMFPTMVEVGVRLKDTVGQLMEHADKSTAVEVEVKDLCARYTTDEIGVCAFGLECNSLQDPNAQFRYMGRKIFEQPRHSGLVQAFMFTNSDFARKLRMKNFSDDVSKFFINSVRQTVEYRQKNNIKRNDFMDMLIELKEQRDKLEKEGAVDLSDDLSNGLTLEQLAAQAMVFFLAGFETSSTTMSFCLYELALNPEVQTKLRKEIVEMLGKHEKQLDYENIKQLNYLDMVVDETLRKYSVLPHIVRQSTAEYKPPNSDFVFPKGQRIHIPVHAIQNDPEFYPNPNKFDPERFTAEEVEKRHPAAYLPFGDGPRNCIGARFGKLQTKIGIATLIRHFEFGVSQRTQIPLRFNNENFLLQPESGVYLTVNRV